MKKIILLLLLTSCGVQKYDICQLYPGGVIYGKYYSPVAFDIKYKGEIKRLVNVYDIDYYYYELGDTINKCGVYPTKLTIEDEIRQAIKDLK